MNPKPTLHVFNLSGGGDKTLHHTNNQDNIFHNILIMKKLLVSCLCVAVAAMSASAQKDLVKNAKKSFELGSDFNTFVESITPAFTNPETAEVAETWYTAGKTGFDNYDLIYGLYSMGDQNANLSSMGNSLLKGYEYYLKALPLDSLPNEKGQVKPKYSKKIISDIAKHHDAFNVAGAVLWGAKEYPAAYEAWTVYLNMPNDPLLGKDAPKALADTIASTINFNRGLAAWQSNQFNDALQAFDAAIALNYDDPMIFEYAAEVARQAKLPDVQFGYAKKGYEVTKDPKFLSAMINHYIDKEDYTTANDLLATAINSAADPKQKAYLLVLKGIIAERTDPEAAKGGSGVANLYLQASELDPQYGGALYNYGRIILVQAQELDNSTPSDMSQSDYNKYRKETLEPMMRKAAEYMEKGYALDNSLTPALQLLQQIYYQLNDTENYERVKNL